MLANKRMRRTCRGIGGLRRAAMWAEPRTLDFRGLSLFVHAHAPHAHVRMARYLQDLRLSLLLVQWLLHTLARNYRHQSNSRCKAYTARYLPTDCHACHVNGVNTKCWHVPYVHEVCTLKSARTTGFEPMRQTPSDFESDPLTTRARPRFESWSLPGSIR